MWNHWADCMLSKREKLKAEKLWDEDGWSEATSAWYTEAGADFSQESLERADFRGFKFPGEAHFDGTKFRDMLYSVVQGSQRARGLTTRSSSMLLISATRRFCTLLGFDGQDSRETRYLTG